MKVIGVIPARYNSTRLEGKPLADIHGKPMIQHVYENARRAWTLESVVVATDDERICEAVRRFGGDVVMTKPEHACGTERVAEVAAASDAAIVVNVQGDEPLLDPTMIDECVKALQENEGAGLSTVMKKIGEAAYHDPDVVKTVRDTLRTRALFLALAHSVSALPHRRIRGLRTHGALCLPKGVPDKAIPVASDAAGEDRGLGAIARARKRHCDSGGGNELHWRTGFGGYRGGSRAGAPDPRRD